ARWDRLAEPLSAWRWLTGRVTGWDGRQPGSQESTSGVREHGAPRTRAAAVDLRARDRRGLRHPQPVPRHQARKDKPRTRVLRLDEESLLLEALHPRFQRFVRFALGTGCRLDEIRGIAP